MVYRQEQPWAERLHLLAEQGFSPVRGYHHYVAMARKNLRAHLQGDVVRYKKYFYVLRPVMALRWLRLRAGEAVPMDFSTLRSAAALGPGVDAFLDDLLARKAKTRELGAGPRVPELGSLAEAESADARDRLETLEEPPAALLAEANALFGDLVGEGG